jgi:molecular chaperone IbpA
MEDMIMRYDFTPLYRSTVGFDHLFDAFDRQAQADTPPGWPPHDIERLSEDAYRISLVTAGFRPDDIDIVQEGSELTVTGRKKAAEESKAYLYRGIAGGPFKLTFNLAAHVKVTGAVHENGVLAINLAREVPEALKPRRIEIAKASGSPQASPRGGLAVA